MTLSLSSGGAVCWLAVRTARKGFGELNELRHLADFFRKRFAGKFLAHSGFITSAVSVYAAGARLPNKFCRDRIARAIARCVPPISTILFHCPQ